MIPKKLKSKDMIGMEVKTTREIRNRAGIVVPEGKIVKITGFGRDFTVETEKCPHCGLLAYISGVTRDDVELIYDDCRGIKQKAGASRQRGSRGNVMKAGEI